MTTTIASKIFTAELNESSEHLPRAARRIVVNSEFLKASKLFTGDLVALSSVETSGLQVNSYYALYPSSKLNLRQKYAVGVIWPSLDIAQDCPSFLSLFVHLMFNNWTG